MKKLLIIIMLAFLLMPLVLAENFGYTIYDEPTFSNTTGSVNRSDYWDNLDTPADITEIADHPHQDVTTTATPTFAQVKLPILNSPTDATLAFGTKTGLYATDDLQIRLAVNDVATAKFTNSYIVAGITATGYPAMMNEAPSLTNPVFSFIGDEDTGVSRSAANQLSFITNGANAMNIDSSQNVGIGTATPQQTLEVIGSGNFTGDLYVRDVRAEDVRLTGLLKRYGDEDTYLQFLANRVLISAGGLRYIDFEGTNVKVNGLNADIDFSVDGDTTDNILKVDAGTERVGIANPTPLAKLDIGLSGNPIYTRTQLLLGNGYSDALGSNYFYRNVGTASGGPIVHIYDDHALSDQSALFIRNDGTGPSLRVAPNGGYVDIGDDVIITGDVSVDGNLNVTGNISGNVLYGEVWNYSSNATAWTFPISSTRVYYNLSGLIMGQENGFEYIGNTQASGGSRLQVKQDGVYKIMASITAQKASPPSALYSFAAVQNNVVSNSRNCYSRRILTNQQGGSVSVSCLSRLSAMDNVSIQIEQEGGAAGDIEIHTVNLNVVRIGN